MYKLVNATQKHTNLLITYKLSTILESAANLSSKETKDINNYVLEQVPKQLQDIK